MHSASAFWLTPPAAPRSRAKSWSLAKEQLTYFFEWFGDLGIFCWRLVQFAGIHQHQFAVISPAVRDPVTPASGRRSSSLLKFSSPARFVWAISA